MLRIGQAEAEAIAAVIESKKLFRYNEGSQCGRFENRYCQYLGVSHAMLTSSGTTALVAALGGLGIGPGDEVIVPAHTYMATAVAVLAVGAIPVIVDVDESITLSPQAFEDSIGPRTRGVIPVHMWGLPCNMDRIMDIARRRNVLVVEDACQGVGGGYRGRKLGSIGHAGAFSFNYFKNMTCGEGGAVVTSDEKVAQVMRCMTDCCNFFWNGNDGDLRVFSQAGSRASEIEGAMMNAQLDRIDALIVELRQRKAHILSQVASVPGLRNAPANSPADECATSIIFQVATPEQATALAAKVNGAVCSKTGRHTFTEWTPILEKRAGHHPAMNPYTWEANRGCRMDYPADMCSRSLDILRRSVMMKTDIDRTLEQTSQLIATLKQGV